MKSKKNLNLHKGNLLDELLNVEEVKEALANCFIEGDLESFKEILSAYVEASNKKQLSQRTKLSRNTVYRALKKENITIETAFEILNAAS